MFLGVVENQLNLPLCSPGRNDLGSRLAADG
jgi:hypothetical protein